MKNVPKKLVGVRIALFLGIANVRLERKMRTILIVRLACLCVVLKAR